KRRTGNEGGGKPPPRGGEMMDMKFASNLGMCRCQLGFRSPLCPAPVDRLDDPFHMMPESFGQVTAREEGISDPVGFIEVACLRPGIDGTHPMHPSFFSQSFLLTDGRQLFLNLGCFRHFGRSSWELPL